MRRSRLRGRGRRWTSRRGRRGPHGVGANRIRSTYLFAVLSRLSIMTTTSDLPTATQRSWHRFLETYEPLRSELYRYCRYLTRSPWDAEDLAQDTLARAFVTLARMGQDPANPR